MFSLNQVVYSTYHMILHNLSVLCIILHIFIQIVLFANLLHEYNIIAIIFTGQQSEAGKLQYALLKIRWLLGSAYSLGVYLIYGICTRYVFLFTSINC